MRTKFTILFFLALLFPALAFAQRATLSGTIIDETTGEPVMYASVVLYSMTGDIIRGTATDEEGKYQITDIPFDTYMLAITSVGFADNSIRIDVKENEMTFDFNMKESTATLDMVTISGNRRAQRITESSSSIQVVSLKEIETAKEPTTYGLLKNLNGIDYFETGLGQQQVNARGFTSVFTGGMLTLVDYRSVSLPGIGGVFGPAMGVNQNDIKQIEVIVGPNSALYGANAAQGVINIITKNPLEYSGTSVTVFGGTNNQLGGSFRSSYMLGAKKKFGYKIQGEYFQAEDFDQTTTIDTLPDGKLVKTNPDNRIQNWTGSGGLYFFPSDNTELSISGGYSNANFVNQSNIGDLQIKGFGFYWGQFRANFGNFLNYGSAFLQVNYSGDDAGDTYNLVRVAQRLALGDPTPVDSIIKDETFVDKGKRLNAEFQNNFNIAEKNIFTWGVQYYNTRPNSEGTFLSDGPDGEPIILNDVGGYLQYENEMVKNFGFILSGRYDQSFTFGGRFSPRVAIVFKPKNHNLRLAYNEAFGSPPIQPSFAKTYITTLYVPAAGPLPSPPFPPDTYIPSYANDMYLRGAYKGFNILDSEGNKVGEVEKLKPTITKGFELGYKGLFANEKFYVDLTLFYSIYENFLSSPVPINNPELILDARPLGVPGLDSIATGQGWGDMVFRPGQDPTQITYVEGFGNELVLTYLNYGKVSQYGANIALTWNINKNFSINGAYAYIHFNEFQDVPEFVLTTPNPNTPTNKIRFGGKYMNKHGSYIEISGRWIEEFLFLGAQEYQRGTVPSYVVVDLKGETPLYFIGAKWMIAGLSINNLFNNKHIEFPGTAEIGFLLKGYLRFNF